MIHYENGEAFCEKVALARLAAEVGTPLYVYSLARLRADADAIRAAFGAAPLLPCYAVKANGNLSLLRELFSRGWGADVVSLGELERAVKAGVRPDRVVFSGVGKQPAEIRRALALGILSFNIESPGELRLLTELAREAGVVAPVSLRINPDIDAKTHPKIATGLYKTKFGMPEAEARALFGTLRKEPALALVGLACHIGSQITDLAPFREAATRLATLAEEAKKEGFALKLLDVGGGLGVRYRDETPPDVADYAKAVLAAVQGTGLSLAIEPGRRVVAGCGVLLTRVVGTKRTPEKHFVIADAGMNDLARPSLYGAWHSIRPAREGKAVGRADVVGPLCETGDVLGLDRELPALGEGDLLVVGDAGAYGTSMASNYNARPRAAEVLVDGTSYRIVRRRETLEDLFGPEL